VVNAQGSNASRPPLPVRAVMAAFFLTAKAGRHRVQRMKVGWRVFRYRSRWTWWGRAAWKTTVFLQAPGETRRRRHLADHYVARINVARMPREKGYCLLTPNDFPGIESVIATCRQVFDRKLREAGAPEERDGPLKTRVVKSGHLRNLLTSADLREHVNLVDFALSDAAFGTAMAYLRAVPRLNRVDLLYSLPRPDDEKVTSQLFHVDPEGLTQVKFFINIFAVDDAEGPFTFIPADETARVIRRVGALRRTQGKQHAGRYLDDEIVAVRAEGAVVRAKGPEGSGVAIDTSRCLHMGSRVRPGAFRLCLYLQYCTTNELGNAFDVERYRNDPVRYLAVQHSLASRGNAVSAPHQMGMQ